MYPEEKARQNPHATLKDLNWVQRHRQFWLGPEKKVLFEEQLRRDTELLQRLGIMDYSLLTGIHNLFKGNSEGLREDKLTVFQVRSPLSAYNLRSADSRDSVPQPDAVKVSRKATQVKRDADASAVRKAVERSDPQALGGEHELPQTDSSERRLFIFYQDEGGMRASDDNDEEIGVIYYLVSRRRSLSLEGSADLALTWQGIIDILTPYTLVKRLEHFFRGLKHNKVSARQLSNVISAPRLTASLRNLLAHDLSRPPARVRRPVPRVHQELDPRERREPPAADV